MVVSLLALSSLGSADTSPSDSPAFFFDAAFDATVWEIPVGTDELSLVHALGLNAAQPTAESAWFTD